MGAKGGKRVQMW